MIRLLILLVLALTACTEGFEVKREKTSDCVEKSDKVYYSCSHVHVWPLSPSTVIRICDTLEECNAFCEQQRSK